MRIAVLSMLEPLAADGLMTRAGVRVNGEPVVEQQLALAIAAGAKRLLVLADRRTVGLDDLIEISREAGLDARIISDAPGLCAEVTAADELLVFGDALLTDPVLALPMLATAGIATLPVEQGLAAGFERIDAETAWGGVLVVPGALAERLRQLPRDCDVASSLLRIALMAGVVTRGVDPAALGDMRWTIVRTNSDAQAIEKQRLRRSLAEAKGRAPGRALAGFAVSRLGSRLFEADRSPALVWWGALVPAAAAIALAAFSFHGAALFALALTWLMVRGAVILDAADRQGRIASALPDRKPDLALLGIDLLLLVVLALALGAGADHIAGAGILPWFQATSFVAMARIGGAAFPIVSLRPFFEDRFSQVIVLQLALFGDALAPIAMVSIMLAMIVWTGHLTSVRLRSGH